MTPRPRPTAPLLLALALLALAPLGPAGAAPGHGAADRGKGTAFACGGADVTFSVDKHAGSGERPYELELEIEHGEPGATWIIALRHNDTRYFYWRDKRADAEGRVEVTRHRPDRPGRDRFWVRVRPAGGTACTARLALR